MMLQCFSVLPLPALFVSGLGTLVVKYTSWAAPQFDPNVRVQKSAGEAAPTVGKLGCNSQVQSSI